MSIRKRRRDRTRTRIANQKRLDAIAYKELNGNMSSSFDTWGGTRCPDCNKPLPSRAFCAGYHTRFTTNDWVSPITGETVKGSTGILSIGTSVLESHRANQATRNSLKRLADDGTVTDSFLESLYSTENCYYCNKLIERKDRTMDHKISVSQGGSHSTFNLVMACRSCNCSKRHKSPEEFFKYIGANNV